MRENGNVLFLILIAVALFAALSYAVTSSTRGGGGDTSREKSKLEIASLVQYSTGLRTAMMRMAVSNGVSHSNMLFHKPADFSSLTPTTEPLAVFHPRGGGATYEPGWFLTCGFDVEGMGSDGTPNSWDVVALKEIPEEMCYKINEEIKYGGYPQFNVGAGVTGFLSDTCSGGGFSLSDSQSINGDTIAGKPHGCFHDTEEGMWWYYSVIAER